MTESTSSSSQSSGPAAPASASRPAGQPASSQPRHSGDATPDVFGDGSTREQQEAQIKAAEEVNKSIKEAGDAERKARED